MADVAALKHARYHMDSNRPEGYEQVIGALVKIWRKTRKNGISKNQVRAEFERRITDATPGTSDEAQRCFQNWGILHQSAAGANFFLFDEQRANNIIATIDGGGTPVRQSSEEMAAARARLQSEFDAKQQRGRNEEVTTPSDRLGASYAALLADMQSFGQELSAYERQLSNTSTT